MDCEIVEFSIWAHIRVLQLRSRGHVGRDVVILLSVPIVVTRAILSLSQCTVPQEADAGDRVELRDERPQVTHRADYLIPSLEYLDDGAVFMGMQDDADGRAEAAATRSAKRDELPQPEDRPRFPTEVSPRHDERHGVSRWSPYGYYYESYVTIRNEQRRDWRLKYNSDDMRLRRDRLLSAHEKSVRAGVAQLRAGNARKALIALSMAAELNQGDPACRIHLMQAQVALGQNVDAAASLRRALELQPKLAYLDLDLGASFSSEEDWNKRVDDLAADVKAHGGKHDVRFLLGYLEFQRGDYDNAHREFVSAAALSPRDELTKKYLQLTRPSRR